MTNSETSRGSGSLITVGIVILAVVAFGISYWQDQQKNIENKKLQAEITKQTESINQIKETILQNTSSTSVSPYPDFDARLDMKELKVVENFDSWTPNAKKELRKTARVIVLEKGAIAKGYLYVRASLNGAPLTRWESIFLTMNFKGGHLFRPQSLPLPTTTTNTVLYYAINDVPYLDTLPYSEQRTPQRYDWSALFEISNRVVIDTFISSLRPAKLESVRLYYSCVNNDDCLLKVQ